jgi:branched-chain amino acid transport system substrate-binding protein
MSVRSARRLAAVALAGALVAAAGCGGDEDPLRVGILNECTGVWSVTTTPALAGAALPLVERGASPGDEPGEIAGATVAGRAIELVPACTEITYYSQLIAETRWLVESQGVDIVIGPMLGTAEATTMPRLAAKYPDVTFLLGAGIARDVTLRDSRPNVFRFTPDGAQSVAGLGSYAFNELGWRRAAVVTEPYVGGWEIAAGFVAEFCALGGTIVERDYQSVLSHTDPSEAAKRHAREADGVALLVTAWNPTLYLGNYAAAVGPALSDRLVVSGPPFHDASTRSPPRIDTSGLVVGGSLPLDPDDESMSAYQESLHRAYPELTPGSAYFDTTYSAYTAMEAVARALEATGGQVGAGQGELRRALEQLVLDAPQGTVRLDRNRQAISQISLEKVVGKGKEKGELETFRTIDGVEQSFGGLFTPQTPSPSWASPACTKGKPPPWAA